MRPKCLLWAAIFALLVTVALPARALAQDASASGPWLRIETGAHTAQTHDAAADAAGTVLVTASDDKTARIWSLPDLRPLGVLRPPIGPNEQGELEAVAVSPDGRLAAIGGWTGSGANDIDVLLFDLQTRQIVRRVAGLANTITALAFSPDGQRLAAGLGKDGIRVWRVSDEALLAEDKDYRDRTYGLAFAPDGRLAAASYDSAIRLYDRAGKQLQRVQTEVGRRPHRIRFDPAGRLLAVGFGDVASVEVRDGANLALRERPDVSGLNGTDLERVGWSADGATLYAGGDPLGGSLRPVFAWTQGGHGARSVAAEGFTGGMSDILPLRNGRLAFTSRDGDIAVVGPDGKRIAERRGGAGKLASLISNDYTDPRWRLGLSRDGTRVAWAFFDDPNLWLHFDARRDEFTASTPPEPDLTNWITKAGGLSVSDWQSRPDPKLNGKALVLEAQEMAESVAVASNRVLLGSAWYLRLFDTQGQELWGTIVPGVAWRVNQSADGRLAVAALNDGTIRWYRLRDGQELLALFVTPDAKRWVAFTPSGYYTASAGGEDLIGWQVNNGRDRAADFFPASRYRDRFYRPEVVAHVLETLDEAEAVQQADTAQRAARGLAAAPNAAPAPQALKQEILQDRPPVVTILTPRDGTQLDGDTASIEAEVRNPAGQAITRVEVRLNARPAPGSQVGAALPLAAAAGETAERRRITVPIEADQAALLQVIAWSNDRSSEPAVLHVRGRPAPSTPVAVADLDKPRLNAVLVGVSAYQAPTIKLKFAAKDAEDFAAALQRQGGPGGLYRVANIHRLPEAQATREAILREIVWLQRETTQRDLAVLFLAGHGVSEDAEYYFLPVDADEDSAPVRGLSGTDLRQNLRRIPGRTVALLDTCYAGALIGNGPGFRSPPPDLNKLINELSDAEAGVAVYSATTGRQQAEERDELHNGVFTRALLDVLSGRMSMANGDALRPNRFADLLAEDVKRLTGGKQASTYNALAPLRDLPLFLVKQ